MVKDRLTKFSNFQIFGFLVAIKMFKSLKSPNLVKTRSIKNKPRTVKLRHCVIHYILTEIISLADKSGTPR